MILSVWPTVNFPIAVNSLMGMNAIALAEGRQSQTKDCGMSTMQISNCQLRLLDVSDNTSAVTMFWTKIYASKVQALSSLFRQMNL